MLAGRLNTGASLLSCVGYSSLAGCVSSEYALLVPMDSILIVAFAAILVFVDSGAYSVLCGKFMYMEIHLNMPNKAIMVQNKSEVLIHCSSECVDCW